MPCARSTARMAVEIAATFPCAPISPMKRPRGTSARPIPASARSGSRIQCSAAFENAASNSARNGRRVHIHDARVNASRTRCLDERRRAVNADHLGTARDDRCRERAVAAANIEHTFAGLRIEPIDDGLAELRDEACVARILLRAPILPGRIRRIRTSFPPRLNAKRSDQQAAGALRLNI